MYLCPNNNSKNGASAIIYNDYRFGDEKITTIKTPNTRKSLSIVASNFYDNPSKKIKLVGVTGTNGKTTVATILFNLFNKAGLNSGLISTTYSSAVCNWYSAVT